MRKVIIILAALSMASCTKLIDTLTTFQFKREATFTLPASATIGIPISVNSSEVLTSHEQEFSSNNTSVENVDFIKIIDLSLSIVAPDGADFNFLKSIELTISSDGLADQVIASKADLQNENVQDISLEVSAEDLKPYLTNDKFSLKIEAVTDEILLNDVEIKTAVTFETKAKTN